MRERALKRPERTLLAIDNLQMVEFITVSIGCYILVSLSGLLSTFS